MPVTETQKETKPKLPASDKKSKKEDTKKTETDNSEEKPKYDSAELLQIFDTMLFEGSYSESTTIKGRLKVSFRTRTADEMQKITHDIDGTTAVLMATIVERRNLLNLYYALTHYQGQDLTGLSYENKVSYVNKLPAPVVGMLMVALYKFDSKVSSATEEGEENF